MKSLGILETGSPPDGPKAIFGDYPGMFRQLLGEGRFAYRTYGVDRGELPAGVSDCDAWLITGSSAGVYDDLPWIEPLKQFLRDARGQAPMIGVCFGHQIMASAFGGEVIKSPKGWGVGLQTYDLAAPAPWTDPVKGFSVAGSHQDQVVVQPPASRVLAGSDFCPFGMLAYEDHPSISLQLHPEFSPDYASALIEARRGSRYTDDQADRALESLKAPNDRLAVGDWMLRFLDSPRGDLRAS